MDEEYLRLFREQQNNNLNETSQWENLNSNRNNQWERLNETPDNKQFNINENVNDGWNTEDFVVETRVNGVVQTQQNNNPYGANRRRNRGGANLNGLDQYLDDEDFENINEVIRQPKMQQSVATPVENLYDSDVVSVDMFENMNSNALLTLNNRISTIDPRRVTTQVSDRQVRIINS